MSDEPPNDLRMKNHPARDGSRGPLPETPTRLAIAPDVVRRAAAGDAAAFDALYEAVFPSVWAFAVRLVGSIPEGQELTERILERVVLDLAGRDGDTPFRTWLARVVYRAALQETVPRRPRTTPPSHVPAAPNR